ncbi:MAG: M36 family metallopeptidase [Saprospiraceae bacterium]|nr:M36 family metallopeptidase [Saprospiraceae bacterium]
MGWHDDGTTTYTITRGNNTHAFADPDSNYLSAGDEPTGGASLIFDYPYNPNGTIAQNKNAGVVNLFYMNNVMHDFAYHYGFTEQAGNFQTKNFSGKGKGNDAVTALAQFGANGSRLRNNADFLPPVDGTNGRMRMFVWNQTGTKLLKVIAPANLATGFETGSAEFGPAVSTTPITGKLTIVSDGTSNATFGCKPLVNAAEVSGKIALIDRGDCFFMKKACNAQAAGALAVIVCNFENTPMGMAAIASPPCNVTIPVISLGSVDCAFLKKNIQTITITLQNLQHQCPLSRMALLIMAL